MLKSHKNKLTYQTRIETCKKNFRIFFPRRTRHRIGEEQGADDDDGRRSPLDVAEAEGRKARDLPAPQIRGYPAARGRRQGVQRSHEVIFIIFL